MSTYDDRKNEQLLLVQPDHRRPYRAGIPAAGADHEALALGGVPDSWTGQGKMSSRRDQKGVICKDRARSRAPPRFPTGGPVLNSMTAHLSCHPTPTHNTVGPCNPPRYRQATCRTLGWLCARSARKRPTRTSEETPMACACEKERGSKCAWCKEAEANGKPKSSHKCQWGSCS